MTKDWARPLVHWELIAHDPEAQAHFYRDLFNWEIADDAFKTVSPGFGGPEPGPGGHIRAGTPAVVLYFQVRDLPASLARATSLGGRVTAEPFDVPGGPTVAFIEDPEGNAVGLVQQ